MCRNLKMDEVYEIVYELKSGMLKKIVVLILGIVNHFESYHKRHLFSHCLNPVSSYHCPYYFR